MRKIILIFMSLLSLNLFGGLVHKDVDTRIKGKFGYSYFIGAENGINIGADILMKSDVYKNKDIAVYVGGKLDIRDDIFYNIINDRSSNFFQTNLYTIFGIEEILDSQLKFYQEFGIGLGYSFLSINNTAHQGNFTGALEFGVNYKNILLSVGTNMGMYFPDVKPTNPNISFGIGYEF